MESQKLVYQMFDILLLITALFTSLIAGLFYSYSCSVNIGLSRLPDRYFVAAMQAINNAILNPMFFMCFIGTLLLLPLSAYTAFHQSSTARFWLLTIASIVYLIGVFGVTVVYNVRLNQTLANFDLSAAPDSDVTFQRIAFEQPWLHFHTIRTIGAIICLALVLISLVYKCETTIQS